MTSRRSFLSSMLAAGMAPAIVKAGILMPTKPTIWVPDTISPFSLFIGTNPQEFRIYNTYYSEAGNWERAVVDYGGRIIKGQHGHQ